jgi:hypothetical protein
LPTNGSKPTFGVGPKDWTATTASTNHSSLFQRTIQTWSIVKWIINHQGSKNPNIGMWSAIGITASSSNLCKNVAFIFADDST